MFNMVSVNILRDNTVGATVDVNSLVVTEKLRIGR